MIKYILIKKSTGDKGHVIVIKGPWHKAIVLKLYVPNKRESNYILKNWQIKRDKFKIIFGSINTLFSKIYRKHGQNVSKDMEDFKNTNNQFDLTETHKTLYLTIAEYILFSSA